MSKKKTRSKKGKRAAKATQARAAGAKATSARGGRKPRWLEGSLGRRQLGLARWLAKEDRGVTSGEIANIYGRDLSSRRTLHRDLRALQELGIPVEWGGRWWRLPKASLIKWAKTPDD